MTLFVLRRAVSTSRETPPVDYAAASQLRDHTFQRFARYHSVCVDWRLSTQRPAVKVPKPSTNVGSFHSQALEFYRCICQLCGFGLICYRLRGFRRCLLRRLGRTSRCCPVRCGRRCGEACLPAAPRLSGGAERSSWTRKRENKRRESNNGSKGRRFLRAR